MSVHELLPDDEERLSRLEYQNERLNRLTTTLKNNVIVLRREVADLNKQVEDHNSKFKSVKLGLICLAIGLFLGGVIWGYFRITDAINMVK
jgi:hypothetical protein